MRTCIFTLLLPGIRGCDVDIIVDLRVVRLLRLTVLQSVEVDFHCSGLYITDCWKQSAILISLAVLKKGFFAPMIAGLQLMRDKICDSLEPSCIRPSHFPSGLPCTRMMSTHSPCFIPRSVLLPLQSTRAFPWWMTSSGPTN